MNMAMLREMREMAADLGGREKRKVKIVLREARTGELRKVPAEHDAFFGTLTMCGMTFPTGETRTYIGLIADPRLYEFLRIEF